MDFDISPYLQTDDPWFKEAGFRFQDVRRIYRDKLALAMLLQPRSILEIGVRAGYGAAAFLSACPGAVYCGIDDDSCTPGFFAKGKEMLALKFAVPDTNLRSADSQHITAIPPEWDWPHDFDMVHVDARHTHQGALHDLKLALTVHPKWIVLDDMTTAAVRTAGEEFVKAFSLAAIELPTFRGDLVIQVRRV